MAVRNSHINVSPVTALMKLEVSGLWRRAKLSVFLQDVQPRPADTSISSRVNGEGKNLQSNFRSWSALTFEGLAPGLSGKRQTPHLGLPAPLAWSESPWNILPRRCIIRVAMSTGSRDVIFFDRVVDLAGYESLFSAGSRR